MRTAWTLLAIAWCAGATAMQTDAGDAKPDASGLVVKVRSADYKKEVIFTGGSIASGGGPQLVDKVFAVVLTIENTHKGKIARLNSWHHRTTQLVDEDGNRYRVMAFDRPFPNENARALGADEALHPGKKVIDMIVFEPPAGGAKKLTLILPCARFGGKGEIRLTIDRGK